MPALGREDAREQYLPASTRIVSPNPSRRKPAGELPFRYCRPERSMTESKDPCLHSISLRPRNRSPIENPQ